MPRTVATRRSPALGEGGLGGELEDAAPAAATGDPVAQRPAVDEPVEVAVLQLDGGLVRTVGGEPQLDLAGVRGIRVVPPVAVDLPGDDQPVRRFPSQHPAPTPLA